MNAHAALKKMVREYPGALDAVAHALGKSPSTLDKELRCAPGYKLGIADACSITAMCHEVGSPHAADYINAVAQECGATVNLEPAARAPSDADLMRDTAAMLRETSQVVTQVTDAGADGRISLNELKRIEADVRDAMASLQRLAADIEAAHLAGMPSYATGGARQ